jgi:hypothetical protein
MVLLIYKTGVAENGDEVVKVIVDIADGDYDFWLIARSVRWSRPSWQRPQSNQKEHTCALGRGTDRRADHFPAFVATPECYGKDRIPHGGFIALHLRLLELRKSTR